MLHYFLHRRRYQVRRGGIDRLVHGERVALERHPVRRQDLADRAQRREETAACERLIHLSHLERSQSDAAEKRRPVRRQGAFDAEPVRGIDDRRQSQVEPEARGCDVVRFRQRRMQRHLAVELFVVILRRPFLYAGFAPDQRTVVEPGYQRVFVRLRQRGEIDCRLDERPDLAYGVERPIEAFITRASAADDREHFAIFAAGDHDRAFQRVRREAVLLFDRGEPRCERLLGGVLHAWIQRRENA